MVDEIYTSVPDGRMVSFEPVIVDGQTCCLDQYRKSFDHEKTVDYYEPLQSIIDHHQPLLTIINQYLPVLTVIGHWLSSQRNHSKQFLTIPKQAIGNIDLSTIVNPSSPCANLAFRLHTVCDTRQGSPT